MVTKYVYAAAFATGVVLQGHSVAARDLPDSTFYKRDSDYGAPAPAPSSSYSSPTSYSAPDTSYSAPSTSYSEPAVSYGAPAASYGAPSYGAVYEDDSRFPDITFIIVGILIITGLALLFPTYVSLTTVRKKRDVDSGESWVWPVKAPQPTASQSFFLLTTDVLAFLILILPALFFLFLFSILTSFSIFCFAKLKKLLRDLYMLSNIIWAAAVAAATVIAHEHEHDHTVVKRDKSDYSKVNRDSEYGAPQAPSFTSSGSTYAAPSTSYSAPAPAPTYSAPAPSYSAPAPSYSSPVASASYSAPSSSYGAPVSYGTSDVSYGSTGYGDEGGKGIDLTAILIPLLALIGLSLLFPTYVSLTTVRKRRSADDPKGKSLPQDNIFKAPLFHDSRHTTLTNTQTTTGSYTKKVPRHVQQHS